MKPNGNMKKGAGIIATFVLTWAVISPVLARAQLLVDDFGVESTVPWSNAGSSTSTCTFIGNPGVLGGIREMQWFPSNDVVAMHNSCLFYDGTDGQVSYLRVCYNGNGQFDTGLSNSGLGGIDLAAKGSAFILSAETGTCVDVKIGLTSGKTNISETSQHAICVTSSCARIGIPFSDLKVVQGGGANLKAIDKIEVMFLPAGGSMRPHAVVEQIAIGAALAPGLNFKMISAAIGGLALIWLLWPALRRRLRK